MPGQQVFDDREVSDEHHAGADADAKRAQGFPMGQPPESTSDGNESDADGAQTSMQKRRRVTRACDECRRKKIKCDGKIPCTHCSVYSYDCSYDQPSHRRRNPAPLMLEQVERKLKRAEALLQRCFPNIGLDDPRFDTLVRQGFMPATSTDSTRSNAALGGKANAGQEPHQKPTQAASDEDPDLQSMVQSTGSLELEDRGYAYYGASSGLNFLRRMGEEFGDIMSPESAADKQKPSSSSKAKQMTQIMMSSPDPDSLNLPPHHENHTPSEHETEQGELPSKQAARKLCHHALDDATAIISCVHQPSFYRSLDRIWDLSSEEYEGQDHRFLPLLYVVMALGCLFAKDGESELKLRGYQSATEEGYKYFWAARQLMDVTDSRDLISLQAIVFMILFLQCSAKLSTCYSYIGIALRSAMRMGLHRSFKDHFSPIESEVRKRLFWVIRKMDIFTSAMLGLPQALSDEDIDQDYPTETNDENITVTGIEPMRGGQTTPLIAAAMLTFV